MACTVMVECFAEHNFFAVADESKEVLLPDRLERGAADDLKSGAAKRNSLVLQHFS